MRLRIHVFSQTSNRKLNSLADSVQCTSVHAETMLLLRNKYMSYLYRSRCNRRVRKTYVLPLTSVSRFNDSLSVLLIPPDQAVLLPISALPREPVTSHA
jgi:hypothetical protein